MAGELARRWALFFRHPEIWLGLDGRELTRFRRREGQHGCGSWWGPDVVDVSTTRSFLFSEV